MAEIDTSGPTVTRRINLASYPCPSKLSLSGNRLWVGYGCAGTWGGGVIGLDITAPASQPVEVGPGMYGAPLVAAAGDTLVTSGSDDSQGDLTVYDTSATPATLRGVIDGQTNALGTLKDLTLTSDGTKAIAAFDYWESYAYEARDTTTLTRARRYSGDETSTDPQAVAVSSDGAHIAGARGDTYGSAVALYDAAATTLTYTNADPNRAVLPGTLAFSGNDLFGVVRQQLTGELHLWRMQGRHLAGIHPDRDGSPRGEG
ncbi:LVIVD repeat-containing protein [Nonomuraea jabiensis]|uniref:hypothetical protein n=1 Tax=Nonomuraea jabiensis TaxID=882448 RepID=UPI0036A76A3C